MPAASTSMLSVQVSDFKDNCLLIQHDRLICDFCSSGQRFACGFLQSTPHDGNLAVRLTLPPVGCVEDFHLQVSAPCRAQSSRRRGLPRCLSHHRAYGSVPRRFLLRVRPSGHTHFCPISTQPYLAKSVRYFPALRPSFEASAQYKQQYGP